MKRIKILFLAALGLAALSGCGSKAGPTNNIPVASITAPTTAGFRATVTLDGSASTDADGETLTYHWRQISGVNSSSRSARSIHSLGSEDFDRSQMRFFSPAARADS